MSIDLHIHTTFSDGTATPTEIVTLAVQKRLTAISITDHDTAAGTAEAIDAGRQQGLTVVPGIEMSSLFDGHTLHILGYYIDAASPKLNRRLEILQEAREERNRKIVEKLQSLGIVIGYDEIVNTAPDGQTGRPHIGKILIQKGYVRTMDQAFSRYLAKGGSAYVSRFVYDSLTAIDIIHECGGLAVLAHPVQIRMNEAGLQALTAKLAGHGLDGIETYYPSHSSSFTRAVKRIAARLDLIMTGGSDYHGDIRPGTTLAGGRACLVPAEVLKALATRAEEKQNAA